MRILHKDLYVIQGPENIKAVFRESGASSAIPFVKFAVVAAFGPPEKAAELYDKDNSGGGHIPHPDSNVEPRNRIDYFIHQSITQFFLGEGLTPFWNRFATGLTLRLHDLQLQRGSDWVHYTDFYQLVGDETMTPFINALCGPHLLRLCPTFLENFWEFDHYLPTFLQGATSRTY